MSRRSRAPRRTILPDPKYGNKRLAKFINMVMLSGKKSVAEHIVYGALARISDRSGQDDEKALEILGQALDNINAVGISICRSSRTAVMKVLTG